MLLIEMHEDCLTDDKTYLTFDDAPVEQPVVSLVRGLCPRAPGIYRFPALPYPSLR
jgi:hypothetical protein